MNEPLTKKLAQKLIKMEGEVRGVTFKTDTEFVLREKGPGGLKEVERKLKELGTPIDYGKLDTMNFYPIGLRVLSLLAIRETFKFSDKDIERMGAAAPKVSLVIKLFTKFFFSLAKTLEQAPRMWEKHYTTGRLTAETHEEERYAIVRLWDLSAHPIFCRYLRGYFATVVQMVVNSPVTTEETKCVFNGDEHHEYLLKW